MSRVAKRGNRLGVPETRLGRMQFHPDGTRIAVDRVMTPSSGGTSVDGAIRRLCREKATPFVRAWMDYAKPGNLEKFKRCMLSISSSNSPSSSSSFKKRDHNPMETTYMVDISRELTTRYLGPAATISPDKKGELYARHIFKPDVLPRVSSWLVKASEAERDAFRDAFTSLTTYYKMRKGARSEYANEIKNKDPDFRARMKDLDEKDAEFATQTLRQLEEDAKYVTTTGFIGKRPPSSRGGARPSSRNNRNSNSSNNNNQNTTSPPGSSRPLSRSSVKMGSRGGGMSSGLHSSNAMRQIAENQAERSRVLKEGEELVSRVTSRYGYLIKPKALVTLESWVAFARPEYKRGLEKLLHNMKKTANKGPAAIAGTGAEKTPLMLASSAYTTTTADANAMATRGFTSAGTTVAADQLVRLYGRAFFREEAWPLVSLFLAAAGPADVDLYRQVFSSFASYHAERKGPKSLNMTDFKYESRKKRTAMAASKDTLEAHGLGKHAMGPDTLGPIRAPAPGSTAGFGGGERPNEEALATKRRELLETLRSTAHNDLPSGSLGRQGWQDKANASSEKKKNAERITASNAKQAPVGTVFDKPEQQSVLGPVKRKKGSHGGFFGKTQSQLSHEWKVAEPDDIAIAIKAKNTKGNNPLGSMLSTGPSHFESAYRSSFKGVRGERPKAVSAEFYK